MAEYIEREAVLNEQIEICHWDGLNDSYGDFVPVEAVHSIPTADVVEVRHGYWKETQGEVGNPFNNQVFDTIDLLVCSVCNEIFDVSEARNYCPNCGAKMDGNGDTK